MVTPFSSPSLTSGPMVPSFPGPGASAGALPPPLGPCFVFIVDWFTTCPGQLHLGAQALSLGLCLLRSEGGCSDRPDYNSGRWVG